MRDKKRDRERKKGRYEDRETNSYGKRDIVGERDRKRHSGTFSMRTQSRCRLSCARWWRIVHPCSSRQPEQADSPHPTAQRRRSAFAPSVAESRPSSSVAVSPPMSVAESPREPIFLLTQPPFCGLSIQQLLSQQLVLLTQPPCCSLSSQKRLSQPLVLLTQTPFSRLSSQKLLSQ